MMNTVKSLAQSTVVYMKRAAVRRNLMSFSDAMLDDIGVSRELLEQGVKAYPWLLKEDKDSTSFGSNTVISQNYRDQVSDTAVTAANDTKEFAQAA
ncbi:DUF1127 domain-containing protein [Thiofilum flexile]|uniref:DUF1127 domain-containing protein n=1 Tax=Thiofilum flexile TaxID=125627 RepID=UPI0013A59675|nr:DUF1127 domain-containing protein [Thiofilum flexile]